MLKCVWLCIAAWLVPGVGHLLLKKRGRGFGFFGAVMVLFCCGLALEGRLFGLNPGFFGILKFLANAGVGLPYVLSKTMGLGVGNLTSYGYEYGNTFLFTAGLLNMLIIVDVFDISRGRKQ